MSVQISDNGRLNSFYLVRLRTDFVDGLHSGTANGYDRGQVNLAQLSDQVKLEVLVFETQPDTKSLFYFGFNWACF